MHQSGMEWSPQSKQGCWQRYLISKHNFDPGWVCLLVLFAPVHWLYFSSLYSLVQGLSPELNVPLRAGWPNWIRTWCSSQLIVAGEVVGRSRLCGCQRWVPHWHPSFAWCYLSCSVASYCCASSDSSIETNLDGDWVQIAGHWRVKIWIHNQAGCHDLQQWPFQG